MHRKLEYINKAACGYVFYKDDKNELKLFFEFGGGDCVAIIYVPTIDKWTNVTKIDILNREEILRYIAGQCIKDQVPSCNYELYEDCIILRTKKV